METFLQNFASLYLWLQVLIATCFTFFITMLGASLVFFVKKDLSSKFTCMLYSLAGGIMLASSIFSLIVPAIEFSKESLPCNYILLPIAIICGIFIIGFISKLIDGCSKTTCLVASITFHNIPEGMCIGIIFAGAYLSCSPLSSALMLTFAIGLQNFPEGSAVSVPLYLNGHSKTKSFFIGSLSGFIEIISGIIACLLTSIISKALPLLLCLAAGMMIYVVLFDIIPENAEKSKPYTMIGFALGFFVMMMFDIMF